MYPQWMLFKHLLGGSHFRFQENTLLQRARAKYPVDFLCRIMGINRSGYYKWKARQGKLNRYEQDRIVLTELLHEEHRRHKAYNILRSMSRGGTPTDNPIIEALNGWMKEELYLDFGLNEAENLLDLLNKYVYFFNNQRPAAALGYKSPVQYKTELGFL